MLQVYRSASSSIPPERVYRKSPEEMNRRLLMKLTLTMLNLGLPSPRRVAQRLLSTDFDRIKLDPGLVSFCRKLRIRNCLHAIIASRAAGYRKPNPETFLIALASIDPRPEESNQVGDSFDSDTIGAMGAGIQPVIIDRCSRSTISFCPVIRSLQELIPLVKSMNSGLAPYGLIYKQTLSFRRRSRLIPPMTQYTPPATAPSSGCLVSIQPA